MAGYGMPIGVTFLLAGYKAGCCAAGHQQAGTNFLAVRASALLWGVLGFGGTLIHRNA
jgi:hypothetical protein